MSGFISSDGSELIGALNPSNVGQALQVDASGRLKVTLMGDDIVVVPSAAHTTDQVQPDQTNVNARGVRVVLDVTANPGGLGSVTLEIDIKDVASGKYFALLTGLAVTTVSTNVYIVSPWLASVANAIVTDVLPSTWRVKVVANNANPLSYSVGASYLL